MIQINEELKKLIEENALVFATITQGRTFPEFVEGLELKIRRKFYRLWS